MSIKVEVSNPYKGDTFYVCPNEDLSKWNEYVGRRIFARSAGICSGGEVGLFVLLPHTKVGGEVVLIDHTTKSLSCALSKVALIQNVGGKKAYELITADRSEGLLAELNKVKEVLLDRYHDWWQNDRSYYGDYASSQVRSLRSYWKKYVTADMVVAAEKKLDQLRFVHGDMRDLKNYGPFNCLYLSNALEHDDWHARKQRLDNTALVAVLQRHGLVLASTAGTRKSPKMWGEPVARERGKDPSYIGWDYLKYNVGRKKIKEAVSV